MRFKSTASALGRLQLTDLSLVTVAVASSPATAATPAAATATISSTTSAAPAAVRTFFARASDIYRQRAAAQFLAVQRANGLLRLFGSAHGYETKAPRTAGCPVHHQVGLDHSPVRSKRVL